MTRLGTRERMLDSAVSLLREGGTGAVTLESVLARSDSPRGSVYHHFPGGRNQLVLEAGQQGADLISALIDSTDGDTAALIDYFLDFWKAVLVDSDFREGCPVAALTLTPGSSVTAEVARNAFLHWADAVATQLVRSGHDPEQARSLSTAAIAAAEGAILLARSLRSVQPLEDVAGLLRTQLT